MKKRKRSGANMVKAFAEWELDELPEDLTEFYISCGVGDDQFDGYFAGEAGAALVIKSRPSGGHNVRLEAPALGLNRKAGYWLSPACIGDVEAHAFGMTNTTKGAR